MFSRVRPGLDLSNHRIFNWPRIGEFAPDPDDLFELGIHPHVLSAPRRAPGCIGETIAAVPVVVFGQVGRHATPEQDMLRDDPDGDAEVTKPICGTLQELDLLTPSLLPLLQHFRDLVINRIHITQLPPLILAVASGQGGGKITGGQHMV